MISFFDFVITLRFRAYSTIHEEGDTVGPDPNPPAPVLTPNKLTDHIAQLVNWRETDLHQGLDETTRILISMARYLSDATMANYVMSGKHKLGLIMLMESKLWRAHHKQVFHYENGAWIMASELKVEAWDALLSLEGLFIQLATNLEEASVVIGCSWTEAESHVMCIVNDLIGESKDVTLALMAVAKAHSDHLRQKTSNKVWLAKWTRRMADMVAVFRKQLDSNAIIVALTKLFLIEWDTPMPRTQGVCFQDVYLDGSWCVADKSPDNNCYLKLDYPFQYENFMGLYPDVNLQKFKEKLRLFLMSTYFENWHCFQIKLCFLHAAFSRACTSKMLFLLGSGGDGKGMEAVLDRALFGESGSSTLDCGVFLERTEFRKSGELAWNKSNVRIQEMDHHARFIADLWKRFVVDEEVDCRVNYGFTSKRKFGISMKIQELNYENIPVIEECGDRRKCCDQLKRRVVCVRLGKGVFTSDDDQVDPAKGVFKLIAQDELSAFLSHPVTAAIYFREWCLPFFKENTLQDSLAMINNLASVSKLLEIDTTWLATCLSGNKTLPPGVTDQKLQESNEVVATVHAATPMKRIVKEYLVSKVEALPGCASSSEGKRTKMANFIDALDHADVKLFQQIDATAFAKLLVDWTSLYTFMQEEGGDKVFGTWADWACPFDLLHIQEKWEDKAFSSDRAYMEAHKSSGAGVIATVSATVTSLEEIVDLPALKQYMQLDVDRRQDMLRQYIERHESHGQQEGSQSKINVEYYQQKHYGRYMARGPSGQKLTKEARSVAFGSMCAEVDAACCHPRLLAKRLKDLGLWDSTKYVMLEHFIANFQAWRRCLAKYMDKPVADAKTELIRIFYGGRPSIQAPFLLKLCDEIQKAAESLIGHPSATPWSRLYADRCNPEFSRLSAMLSFAEAEMLTAFTEKCPTLTNVLVFDGAYMTTMSFAAELDMVIALDRVSEEITPLEVKSWAKALRPASLPHAALRRGAIVDPVAAVPVTENCLLYAFSIVAPDVNMEALRAHCSSTAPMSASSLNHALKQVVEANSNKCLQLIHANGEHMTAKSNDVWICHQTVDLGHGHWWAALFPQSGGVAIVDGWAEGRHLWLPFVDFQALMEETDNITCFRLVEQDTSNSTPIGAEHTLSGNGPRPTAVNKKKFVTSRKSCVECGAPLAPDKHIDARLYTLSGVESVHHVQMRCTRKSCRVYHHYNLYRWLDGRKINTCQAEDIECVFMSSKTGFSKDFLNYHAALQFRGCVSNNAIAWAQEETLWNGENDHYRWSREYAAAALYYSVIQAAEDMWSKEAPHIQDRKLQALNIEDPLADDLVHEYSAWWHSHHLSAAERNRITEIVMDGHEKVSTKCSTTPPARVGRPRKDGRIKQRHNGWFMSMDPGSGLVIAVSEMTDPENNEVMFQVLQKTLLHAPNADCVIYDRICRCMAFVRKHKELKRVKSWCVDRFHARGHSSTCECSPLNVKRLDTRLKGVNTSIAEQTFAWFRGYAATFNSKSRDAHIFTVLRYVDRHNNLIRNKYVLHLNKFSANRRVAKSVGVWKKPSTHKYTCRRPAAATSSGSGKPSTSSTSIRRKPASSKMNVIKKHLKNTK